MLHAAARGAAAISTLAASVQDIVVIADVAALPLGIVMPG